MVAEDLHLLFVGRLQESVPHGIKPRSNLLSVDFMNLSGLTNNPHVITLLISFGVVFIVIAATVVLIRRSAAEQNKRYFRAHDELLEQVARIDRYVQKLGERIDSLEERVRVEVLTMGRSMSAIIGRSEAATSFELQNDTRASKSFSSKDIQPRTGGSRTDLSRLAEELDKKTENEPLKNRLVSTRRGILSKLKAVFIGFPSIDSDLLEELEVLLVTSDIGLKTASALLKDLKTKVREGGELTKEEILSHLHNQLTTLLNQDINISSDFAPVASAKGEPKIVFVVGVNGVGKTTTVAKLAHRWVAQGGRVVLAAADTFRAAADEQLKEWGKRVGVQVVSGEAGDKPSTVVHSAVETARRERADVVLIDTAGRLHNRGSLMQELEGMVRAVKKIQPNSPEEVWLVIDGTTGQNALVQAREFQSSVPLTGVIVTKLDGTAKGGVVVAVREELGIPVRFIGVGETWSDLRPFNPDDFVTALLGDGNLEAG